MHGPYEPDAGHRFNPNKLLLDPYAKGLVGRLQWRPEIFGYTIGAKDEDLSFDERDSAPFVPKCRVVDPAFTLDAGPPAGDPVGAHDHLRGARQGADPAPPAGAGGAPRHRTRASRGPRSSSYLKGLGVTAVELLPIHAFVDDGHLLEKGLTNYWGYNTIGFFAPEPALLRDRRAPPSSSRWWPTCTTPASR